MDTSLVALNLSTGFAHPLFLDVVIGVIYGLAIGLALSSLRSNSP